VTLFSNWTSGTIGVATVVSSTGVATGVTAGVSLIAANFGGKTGTANLTVTAATLASIADARNFLNTDCWHQTIYVNGDL
jgi:uncharacterized protein YjdB